MGIIDKLKFWDHGDDLDLDLDEELPPIENEENFRFNDSTNQEGSGQYDWNKRDRPSMNQMKEGFQNMPQGTTGDIQKDLDLISSKLDTIKAELDGMDQRIRKIEKIAEGESGQAKSGGTRASRDPWSNY